MTRGNNSFFPTTTVWTDTVERRQGEEVSFDSSIGAGMNSRQSSIKTEAFFTPNASLADIGCDPPHAMGGSPYSTSPDTSIDGGSDENKHLYSFSSIDPDQQLLSQVAHQQARSPSRDVSVDESPYDNRGRIHGELVDVEVEEGDGLMSEHYSTGNRRSSIRRSVLRGSWHSWSHQPNDASSFDVGLESLYSPQNKWRRCRFIFCSVIFVIVVLAISLGVTSKDSNGDDSSPSATLNSPSDTSPPKDNNGGGGLVVMDPTMNLDCDYSKLPAGTDPSPYTQCVCDGHISIFPQVWLATYHDLKNRFVADILPDFDEKISLDSCQPVNIALSWLSTDHMAFLSENKENFHTDHLDKFVLAILYAATKGHEWKSNDNWLSLDVNVCSWFGVRCDSSGRVTQIELNSNNLRGTLPSELSVMSNLEILGLGYNHIGGTIPSELGGFSLLRELTLSTNLLEGSIPNALGNLASLKRLELDFNLLSGTLPVELSKLTQLEYVGIWDNEFSGTLPPEYFTAWTLLREFYFQNNALRGQIPIEIGLYQLEMKRIDGSNNPAMTGPIPSQLGILRRLESINWGGMGLTGTIPTELEGLLSLKDLALSDNSLVGSIPSSLAEITDLESLLLSNNAGLSGELPYELQHLSNLKVLELSNCNLEGNIPEEYGDLISLERMNLSGNKMLEGPVPDYFCMLRDNGELDSLVAPCSMQCPIPDCCTECA